MRKTCENCIGAMRSGILDIQPVRISIALFGLPDHKSTPSSVATCVGRERLGVRASPRKSEKAGVGLECLVVIGFALHGMVVNDLPEDGLKNGMECHHAICMEWTSHERLA
ncbi:hypothetical protein AVEN_199799-1 [Araneus ventricosus]|uniref:Uncharacterized protein n=1 Tax=Araneus ventricosus TaxID=182803 RepID=A0A4Y2J9L8_ARAVE|nr:hypothetical protein AVEN_199799-1 [Araneus ventricosus]